MLIGGGDDRGGGIAVFLSCSFNRGFGFCWGEEVVGRRDWREICFEEDLDLVVLFLFYFLCLWV